MTRKGTNLLNRIAAIILPIVKFFFASGAEQAQIERMNVIFILVDDLGWSDCTLYGSTDLYETPNIERLASRGITFTNAYAASPLSSPTRASILTGQTPTRHGIINPDCHLPEEMLNASVKTKGKRGEKALEVNTATRLDTVLPTLGKLINTHGYATAHFGKWHLGREPYSPLEHGYELDIPHWAGPGPAGSYIAPWKFPEFCENYPQEHIEDRMVEEATSWLRTRKKGEPFYMNYWTFSVHGPWDAKEKYIEYYKEKIDTTRAQRSSTYAAMVHSLDEAIGKILDEIDYLGLSDNTAIIFMSDNGGNEYVRLREFTKEGKEYYTKPTSNSPLRGGKATMFEGGIRVPCIVVWPGIIKPGTITNKRIQSTDFYPTILNLLNISIPEGHLIDGVDISPIFKENREWKRDPMFTYFPTPPRVPDWLPPAISVHDGEWKLIRLFYQGENQEHDYLLFNLTDDISETNNLANLEHEKVMEMDLLIEKHINETKAVIPKVNPNFDPSKYKP